LSAVAVTVPCTVVPVDAAKNTAPAGSPSGPVPITCPVGVTRIWQPSMSTEPPSAPGLFTGSMIVAVRARALIVMSASERMVMSPPKLSPPSSISALTFTFPPASYETSSLEPNPVLSAKTGPSA
jgi:hypothetical protein